MLSKRQREERINRAFGPDPSPEAVLSTLSARFSYDGIPPATWGLQLCKWRESTFLPAILNALRARPSDGENILAATLAQAAEDGHVELVKAILAAQAPHPPIQFWSNTRWARYSALRVAAANGRKDCFEILLATLGGYIGEPEGKLLRAILRMNTVEVL